MTVVAATAARSRKGIAPASQLSRGGSVKGDILTAPRRPRQLHRPEGVPNACRPRRPASRQAGWHRHPVRDARRDGLRAGGDPRERIGRDLARRTVHAAALGLRHRRRAHVRDRAAPADHSRRPRLPRPGRRPGASFRGNRVEPHRRLPAGRAAGRPERRAARRARVRADQGAGERDRRPGRAAAPRPDRPDPRRIVADVRLRHDPDPDGGAKRLHRGLVRCAPLGPGDRGPDGDRMGGRRRDPGQGRHLPLPGRSARSSPRGGRSRDAHRPDADRQPSRPSGVWRSGVARPILPAARSRGIAVAALG